jgi:hypothetical protein
MDRQIENETPDFEVVVRKNSIRLPSDRDVGTYFGFAALENPRSQPLCLANIRSACESITYKRTA